MRCRCLLRVALFGILLAACMPGYAGILRIEKPLPDSGLTGIADVRAEKWFKAPVRDLPSKRHLLRRTEKQFPQVSGRHGQDVLRLCAIRVEFESVPDPAKISGNGGRFDLSDRRSTIFIDPPPHNRKYFSKHMEALANYFRAMSYGKLEIQWEVFPLATDGAYRVPGVEKYNPEGVVGSWSWDNLELFFRDAITAADQDPDLRFGDFDAFLVFHAGSDWQNDLRGDSPYDIPSFFISLAESIAVDDSTFFVFDGSVVPETGSQDGYLNGINGVVAHETGHQVGLPDLYDTQTGISAVGYWDLMDFGSGVGVVLEDPRTSDAYFVTGILPGSISAWSKSVLGWVVPDTLTDQAIFTLRATELQGESPNREAVMIPINSYEYFIIENRQSDLDGDSTGIILSDPSPDSTGVIMGPVDADRQFNYEYDWPLPGSGLLVWRIDDVMVRLLSPYDAVNAFPQRRGVRLLEADGIPDLGDYNSFYFLGSPYDPFFRGNNDLLADDTYPNSRSGSGCYSHIVVDGISESSIAMDLRAKYDWRKRGFPLALGDSLRFGVPSLLVGDTDGDSRDEVEAALKRAAWKDSVRIVDGDTVDVQYVEYSYAQVYAFDYSAGGGLGLVPGWPRRLHGSNPTELTGADLDGDGRLETLVADETGRVYVFRGDGSAFYPWSDSLAAFLVGERINGGPVAFRVPGEQRDRVALGTDDGVVFFGESGQVVDQSPAAASDGSMVPASQPVVADLFDFEQGLETVYYTVGAIIVEGYGGDLHHWPVACSAEPDQVFLAVADLDRKDDAAFEVLLVSRDGWVWVFDSAGQELPGWGKQVCDQVVGPPAFADVNTDGYLEVILTDRNFETRVFTWNGSHLAGWPEKWFGCSLPAWDGDFFTADTTIAVPSPVVADFGCGGQLGIFQGSLFECIVGWGPDGAGLEGFPVTLGGGCSSVAIGDIDGDSRMDLVAGSGDGHLYGFSNPGCSGADFRAPWRTAYFGVERNCVYPMELLPPVPEPGTRLLVEGSFHAFPNPVTSGAVTFAFESDTGGDASVEIFDLTGATVSSARFFGSGKVEKTIDLADLGNGLYVCRLDLAGGGKKASEFFKLAIKR